MITKKIYKYVTVKALLSAFLVLSMTANAQHFTVTLANFTSTSNTFEVDVLLIVEQPAIGVRLGGVSTGINYNTAILNGGVPCTTADCGSWAYIPGTIDASLTTLNPTVSTNRSNPAGHLRIVQITAGWAGNPGIPVNIPAGTYNMGRYRFTNTVDWTHDSNPQLWLTPTNAGGSTNTIVCFYDFGSLDPLYAYTTTFPQVPGGGVTLGYTQAAPLSAVLNPTMSVPENNVSPLQVAPNPFSDSFQLDFESVSNEPVTLKVYDMLGKLIESHTIEPAAISSLQLGENYQSGIYNISVSQGEKNQNVRVIKR